MPNSLPSRDLNNELSEILKSLKVDQYFLRKDNFNAELETKNYLILLANKNNLERKDILFLLKNILKYLNIPENGCVFIWPDESFNQEACREIKAIKELFLKAEINFIFNFGVNLNPSFYQDFSVTMETLDLSSVLLDPKLKRQVFQDVSRLLLSTSRAE